MRLKTIKRRNPHKTIIYTHYDDEVRKWKEHLMHASLYGVKSTELNELANRILIFITGDAVMNTLYVYEEHMSEYM